MLHLSRTSYPPKDLLYQTSAQPCCASPGNFCRRGKEARSVPLYDHNTLIKILYEQYGAIGIDFAFLRCRQSIGTAIDTWNCEWAELPPSSTGSIVLAPALQIAAADVAAVEQVIRLWRQ